MNTVFDRHPSLFECICQLAHRMLCLRCGHAIAGHEHDFVCVGHLHCDVLQTYLAHSSLLTSGSIRCGGTAEGPEQHVSHRTVHRPAHQDRENESGEAVEGTSNNQDVILQHEAGGGGGESCVGIQQRHDYRHVCRTNRHHEEQAEDKCQTHHHKEERHRAGHKDQVKKNSNRCCQQRHVENILPAIGDRRAAHQSLQLGK